MTDTLATIRAQLDGQFWEFPSDPANLTLTRAQVAEVMAALEGWQPIETAPKDGTRLLLIGHRRDQIDIGSWGPHGLFRRKTQSYEPAWGSGPSMFVDCTHWQPLPQPPKPQS